MLGRPNERTSIAPVRFWNASTRPLADQTSFSGALSNVSQRVLGDTVPGRATSISADSSRGMVYATSSPSGEMSGTAEPAGVAGPQCTTRLTAAAISTPSITPG